MQVDNSGHFWNDSPYLASIGVQPIIENHNGTKCTPGFLRLLDKVHVHPAPTGFMARNEQQLIDKHYQATLELAVNVPLRMSTLQCCRIDLTVKILWSRKDSSPHMDTTHGSIPHMLYQLSYEVTPNDVRTFYFRISGWAPKVRKLSR